MGVALMVAPPPDPRLENTHKGASPASSQGDLNELYWSSEGVSSSSHCLLEWVWALTLVLCL